MSQTARPLRSRLLAISLLVAALILGISFMTLYFESMSTLMNQYQETAIDLMSQASIEIRQLLSRVEGEAIRLQLDSSLQRMFTAQGIPELKKIQYRRDFLDKMRQYLSNESEISAVLIIDQQGRLYGTSKTRTLCHENGNALLAYDNQRIQIGQSAWIGGHMDTDFALLPDSPYYGSDGTDVLLCARKINSGAGLGGVILLALPSRLILERLSNLALPSDNICITDSSGIQLLGTNPSQNKDQVTHGSPSKSSFYTNDQGKEMHLINLPLTDDLYLVSMVPMSYYQDRMRPILYVMGFIGITTLLLLSVCCVAASFYLEKPFKSLVKAMDQAGNGDLEAHVDGHSSILEFQKISQGFNQMLFNIRSLMEENMRIEREKREAEMESLQSQINPHFLFNTLTSIRWLAVMTKSDGVAAALTNLSHLLRPLFYEPQNLWTLKEEIEFIEYYISLMEMRFGSQVEFQTHIQPQTLTRAIPRFILQPILENSYEHAGGSGRQILLTLSIGLDGAFLKICIADNGQGMNKQELEQLRRAMLENHRTVSRSGSIALVNVYRRLKLCYGEEATLHLNSAPNQGFQVIVRLPDKNPR